MLAIDYFVPQNCNMNGSKKKFFLNAKSKKARNVPKVKYGEKVHFSPGANRVLCSENI